MAIRSQIKEDKENVLIVVPVVLEGPAGFEDGVFPPRQGDGFLVDKEFESRVGGKNSSEEEISLICRDVVREGKGFREGDVEALLRSQEGMEKSGIILEKSTFDVLDGLRKESQTEKQWKDSDLGH